MAKKITRLHKKAKSVNHPEADVSVEVVKNLGKGDTATVSKKEPDSVKENRNCPSNMLKKGECIVGLTKGATINLGNYQSARFDVTITRVVNDDEHTILNELVSISDMIDEQLEYETDKLEEDRN